MGGKAIHPDLETLIRCRDAELAPEHKAGILAHLKKCSSCRVEYEHLCGALASVRREIAPPIPQFLTDFKAAVGAWNARKSKPDMDMAAIKERVIAEIAPFLGRQAASNIIETVNADGQNLLGIIEPVLAHFLGNRAASILVNHVIDTAIVRI